jgi:hypothetical protein
MPCTLGSVKKRIKTPMSTIKASRETANPHAVDSNATEVPLDTVAGVPAPFVGSSLNALLIPKTVPTTPIIGGTITPVTDIQMDRNQNRRRRRNLSAFSEGSGELWGVS